jgi:tRNA modification GTPase
MNDTMAALSTAPGSAVRAIVRISGPEAFSISRSLLREGSDPSLQPGFSLSGVVLASGLRCRMLVMRAPRSYTTEDVVEFHLPGAPALCEALLEDCLNAGCRRAGPGEFTQRAYLGGRIDAAQVEGVLALVESRTEEELRAAVHLLEGGVMRHAARVRRLLVQVLSSIEAYLDFTEEDTEAIDADELKHSLEESLERIRKMEGRMGRRVGAHLPRVVLLGPANAGKSTLFKALVPASRVLTSPWPGTTRDLIEGEAEASGRAFLLHDTPGVMESSDPLERLALSNLGRMMEGMDAVITVFDGSAPPDGPLAARIIRTAGRLPSMTALNKSDLPKHPAWKEWRLDAAPILLSAREGKGLETLKSAIAALLPPALGAGGAAFDLETRTTLKRAGHAIAEALDLDWEGGLELVAMELREATQALGLLFDPVIDEEILEAVFSRFCIGK